MPPADRFAKTSASAAAAQARSPCAPTAPRSRPGSATGRIYAAVAKPGEPFGRAEAVSDRTEAEDLDATFDAAGRPLVTWTVDGRRLRASRR